MDDKESKEYLEFETRIMSKYYDWTQTHRGVGGAIGYFYHPTFTDKCTSLREKYGFVEQKEEQQ